MPTTVSVDRVVEAWELYSSGSYSTLIEIDSSERDVIELQHLARLELNSNHEAPAGKGLFAALLKGMSAFHAQDYKKATAALGKWLGNKAYFNRLALERFLVAAERAREYAALYKIGGRFMDREQYHPLLIGPLFRASFQMEQYAVCGKLFDSYRKHFGDPQLLQRTALALLHLNRAPEAEKILMTLYRKLTGKNYATNYKQVAAEYAPIIDRIPELEERKRNPREDWELGMAYLFNRQFDAAMSIFRDLQKSAA